MANKDFDPSGVAQKNGNFFGLPYSIDEAEIVILPFPWDVTTSYGDGTSKGPQAMLEASYQLDLSSPFWERAWETKIATLPLSKKTLTLNKKLRAEAKRYINFLENGGEVHKNKVMAKKLANINKASKLVHNEAETLVKSWRNKGKKVVLLGGDHSTSFGAIKATAEEYENLSILHIDAHADLRDTYEGFPHSHASIMFEALKFPGIKSLTQVGIRDFSADEQALSRSNSKIHWFTDWDLQNQLADGNSWSKICDAILKTLGSNVYFSFDIDGLDPKFCPHTGTPVPGGLELQQVLYLLNRVVESGRKLVGADLVEVCPGPDGNEWDANVGSRALFHICQLLKKSSSPEFALTHPSRRRSMAL